MTDNGHGVVRGKRMSAVALGGVVLAGGLGLAWWALGHIEGAPAGDLEAREASAEAPASTQEPLSEPAVRHLAIAGGEDVVELEAVLQEPVLKDTEVLDQFEEVEEEELLSSDDSPFDEENFNEVIGIGGGIRGSYGGRFGGRVQVRRGSGNNMVVIKTGDMLPGEWAGESYESYAVDDFRSVIEHPLSTFSIDVDRASYTNARRMIEKGVLPPAAAVRVEEIVNHFSYDYPLPEGEAPLALDVEVAACPWRPENRLVRVALASRVLEEETRRPRNLVFLVDVSGSMDDADKLPLLKRGLRLLIDKLDERDSLSIVTYASGTRVALEPTRGDQRDHILDVLDQLEASGSTNGAGGIQLAYELASQSFIDGGVNRVLLGTDGDFNVGIQSRDELVRLIEEKRESGVFLTVLGFGEGNLKDANLEQIANKGNGHYLYVDSMREARRVFVEEAGANLVTVAKDVKLQVEFNPAEVASYRLVGYANRKLAAREFNDDQVDAGEVGAGHGVTAFYEVVPAYSATLSGVDDLRYQTPNLDLSERAASGELMTVKLRYKLPEDDQSQLMIRAARDGGAEFEAASGDFRFAAAAAMFGEVLACTSHVGGSHFEDVLGLLEGIVADDPTGQRTELFDLVLKAQEVVAE